MLGWGGEMKLETTKQNIEFRPTNVFFGFALADSMFSFDCDISRRSLSVEEVLFLS